MKLTRTLNGFGNKTKRKGEKWSVGYNRRIHGSSGRKGSIEEGDSGGDCEDGDPFSQNTVMDAGRILGMAAIENISICSTWPTSLPHNHPEDRPNVEAVHDFTLGSTSSMTKECMCSK